MDMPSAIRAVTERRNLSVEEMADVMSLIMTGEATPAQIGGFLIGLRMKGETVDEIASAARVMRDLATRVEVSGPHLVDTCGTGGDGQVPLISRRPVPLWWRPLGVRWPSMVTVLSPASRVVLMYWRRPGSTWSSIRSRWHIVSMRWGWGLCLPPNTMAP